MWTPSASTSVEHHGLPSSAPSLVQPWWVTPLRMKGKAHSLTGSLPPTVTHLLPGIWFKFVFGATEYHFKITFRVYFVVYPLEEFRGPEEDIGCLPQRAAEVAERNQPAELMPGP